MSLGTREFFRVKQGMRDRWLDWFLRGLTFVVILPTSIAVLSSTFFVDFLPSLDWARASRLPGQALAAVTFLVTCGVLVFLARDLFAALSWFKAGLVLVAGPLTAAMLAMMTVTFTLPFLVTLMAGSPSEQRYWVDSLPVSSKHCRRAVTLREIDGLGRICGLPEDIHDRLYPGAAIVVTGRGTRWGIFVQEVRLPW